ncbi:hypothetical protein WAK64_19090 [Bacillus spongiae]|uniref:MFS transporter n=1 Tax=Bacillus spongiae TaxID=2683610 RepID=A0ABU8HJ94_9BACI
MSLLKWIGIFFFYWVVVGTIANIMFAPFVYSLTGISHSDGLTRIKI